MRRTRVIRDGPFRVAEAERRPGGRPKRFDAPLGTRQADYAARWSPERPPDRYVCERLERADPEMRARVVVALRAADAEFGVVLAEGLGGSFVPRSEADLVAIEAILDDREIPERTRTAFLGRRRPPRS
jgi:hypothetical protein